MTHFMKINDQRSHCRLRQSSTTTDFTSHWMKYNDLGAHTFVEEIFTGIVLSPIENNSITISLRSCKPDFEYTNQPQMLSEKLNYFVAAHP